jgi:hypothetical protein
VTCSKDSQMRSSKVWGSLCIWTQNNVDEIVNSFNLQKFFGLSHVNSSGHTKCAFEALNAEEPAVHMMQLWGFLCRVAIWQDSTCQTSFFSASSSGNKLKAEQNLFVVREQEGNAT